VSTISVTAGLAGGRGERSIITGFQFTEVGLSYGGARSQDALIGSFDELLVINSWSPEDGDTEVENERPVIVNIEATNTDVYDQTWDDASDFDAGTHDDTQADDQWLGLQTVEFTEDWEGATPLDNWTNRTSATAGLWTIFGSTDHYVGFQKSSKSGLITADDGPVAVNAQIKAKFYRDSNNETNSQLSLRVTGAGTALRGYVLFANYGNNYMAVARWSGDGNQTGIGSTYVPAMTANIWFWLAFKVTSDNRLWFKQWEDGDPEPSSWSGGWTDTTHTGAGAVGVGGYSSYYNKWVYINDVIATPDPPDHLTSGTWTSEVIDLSSIGTYGYGKLTWDEVLPDDTTLVCKIKFAGDDDWTVTTNGGKLPVITYGAKMATGSPFGSMQVKFEFATTDIQATPTVDNLRLYYEPMVLEELDLIVDGVHYNTAADNIYHWGRAWLGTGVAGVGPVLEDNWSDIWISTPPLKLEPDLKINAASLEYDGAELDAITFTRDVTKHYVAGQMESYFTMPPDPYMSAASRYWYTTLHQWNPNGKPYYWRIFNKGTAIHADAKYLVGHSRIDTAPMSLSLAISNRDDHPLSILIHGYKRDDQPLSLLTQAWKRDDFPLAVSIGLWTINDQPISYLTGVRYLNDNPLSMVVFGVNREGMIEVNIISDKTWDELTALGYTRS